MVKGLKKFHKLIESQLFYLLTKRNLIVLVIFNVTLTLFFLIESQIFKGSAYVDSYRTECLTLFTEGSFTFVKIFYLLFVLFINLSYFQGSYSNYSQYYITDTKSKISFYITKYLSLIIFDFIEFSIIYLINTFIYVSMPYGMYPFQNLDIYFSLFLSGIYYMLLSSIILMISSSNLSLLIPVSLFWGGEIIRDSVSISLFFKKMVLFLTVTPTYDMGLPFGNLHAILMIVLTSLIISLIISLRD